MSDTISTASATLGNQEAAQSTYELYDLTKEQFESYRNAFDMFDKNRDGKISIDEIKEVIKRCGLKPSDDWVKDLMDEADRDSSGTIEFPEFMKAMGVATKAVTKPEPVAKEDPEKAVVSEDVVQQKHVEVVETAPDAVQKPSVQEDYPLTEDEPEDHEKELDMVFDDLGLAERTLQQAQKLHEMQLPTVVQSRLLRALPDHKHILVLGRGQAGKTMAGILATLKTVDFGLDKVQVVYIVYSKGMAGRVTGILNDLSPDPVLKVYRAISGSDVQRDLHTLFRSVNHVIVGTPGRLLDLVERDATDFHSVKLVVVDQADLILNLPRRKRLTCSLVHALGDRPKIIALSRSIHPGILMFRRNFLGGSKCHQVTERRRDSRRFSSRASYSEGRQRISSSMSASGAPPSPWKYAIICGEREDDVSDELLQKFFTLFLGQMSSRGGRRAPWRLETKPAMISRIHAPPAMERGGPRGRASESGNEKPEEAKGDNSEHSKARFEEYKAAIDEAKDNDVTVIFYTSPALIGGDAALGQLRSLARDNKIIFQGLRIDYVKNFEKENPPVGLIRGQTNTLLGHYRWLRRNQDPESGRSEAEDTGDEKGGTPGREQRRQRRLVRRLPGRRIRSGQTFSIIGPAVITLKTADTATIVRLASESQSEKEKGTDVDGPKGATEDDTAIDTQTMEISTGMVLIGHVEKVISTQTDKEDETTKEAEE